MDIYSVSEITKYVKNLMDKNEKLSSVLVRGEISNFKRHYSGHCYFTLKDQGASIKAVLFKSKAQYLKFMPIDGMKVVANGRITVFERDGQYQLYIDGIFPEGAGELSVAFEQLKEKLMIEGLFEEKHKRKLPEFPKKIGVITSATGAVLRDIFKVSKRRNPNIQLCLYPVLVQGEGSAQQIVHAIEIFNTMYPVDLLIIGRGGGSLEDLWSFNEESVVRAIYQSEIPIISAIGHETDYTLCDFVSDVRAATPSQAAELAIPEVSQLNRYIQNLLLRMQNCASGILREKRSQLSFCIENKIFKQPQLSLESKKQQVDFLLDKLVQFKTDIMKDKTHCLQIAMGKLQILNPLLIVARGYGIVKLHSGSVLKSVKDVQNGEKIEIVLKDGSVDAIVQEVKRSE